ncbi:MAG: FMN-binding protein [Candidatus Atribacteria bacterium]|nr:FMN-binding protein [Candidatus Atribacteria bacterium]
MRKVWKILLLIILILVALLGIFWGYLTYGLQETQNLILNAVDLSAIGDGTYHGKYVKGRFTCEVEVVVKDHAIVDVKLISFSRISVPTLYEELMARVKNTNALPVDTVSGATASSKAFLKAVENALKQ